MKTVYMTRTISLVVPKGAELPGIKEKKSPLVVKTKADGNLL